MTDKQIVKYDLTEAKISEMAALYMDLTVEDFDDQKGFEEVELARKAVKSKRVAIEKQRKVFKADALEYGRMVDSKAKEIVALLDPIESHLISEGDKVRNELARIKAEEEDREKAKIQARVDDLLKVGVSLEYFTVATMSDEDFNALYFTSRTNCEAEQARLEKEAEEIKAIAEREEKERREEIQRLADEAVRLEKIRKEQEAKEAELKAAQDKIDAEKREQERQKELEIAKKEAAEKAAKDERERIEREAREAKEKAEREASEAAEAERQAKLEVARQEALKPDKEKLEVWVDSVLSLVEPELENPEARELLTAMVDGIGQVLAHFNERIERL